MKLWICNETRNLLSVDVTLEDGAIPCVDDKLVEIPGVQPGIWAKVLILRSICINLEEKVLYWTTCSCEWETRIKHKMERRMELICQHDHQCFLKRDDYYETDFDRLLEIAKKMYNDPGSASVEAVHLLHVYLLPSVTFNRDTDQEQVNKAVQEQNKNLERLDEDFDQSAENREKIKNSLRDWRMAICEQFENQTADFSECGTEFLEVFLEGLKRDLQLAYVEISNFSDEAEKKKREIDICEESQFQQLCMDLEMTRRERDKKTLHLSRALYFRAEIELFLKNKLVPAKPKEAPEFVEGYLKTMKLFREEVNKKIANLSHKKVCAVSVREALHRMQHELKIYKETSGLELHASGNSYSVDVLQGHSLPEEWQSIQDRVKSAVESDKEVKALDQRFRADIKKICATVKSTGQKRSTRKKLRPERSIHGCPDFKKWDHKQRVNHLQETFRKTLPREHFLSVAEQMQQRIESHFTEVSDIITKRCVPKGTCQSRVWLCYERCTFPDLFSPYILNVYKLANQKEIESLKTNLPKMSLQDLNMEDKDKYLLNLLGLYHSDTDSKEYCNVDTKDKTEPKSTPDEDGVTKVKRRIRQKKAGYRNNRFTVYVDGMVNARGSRSFTAGSTDSYGLNLYLEKVSRIQRSYSSRNKAKVEEFHKSILQMPDYFDSGIFTDQIYPGREVVSTGQEVVPANDTTSQVSVGTETPRSSSISTSVHESTGEYEDITQEVFRDRFALALDSFSQISGSHVPVKKLHLVYKMVSEIVRTAEKQAESIHCGKKVKLTGDEVPALIILFLANCDPTKVADMYPQIQFLESYLPYFMASGHIGYTVATVLSAYAFILHRIEDVRKSNCSLESEAEEAQENPGTTQSVPNNIG
ncbi:hypothetical protein HOLleu_41888 [Holothuria leucospilota]|uniref:VPS9 domain-containing protein n=1 Tax=Holothuria leucospilota TaxID=206669 RepID=A0A9Q0YC24_HOLLE|nr:hypothetical protein HOLleu_41888 [Holothuria leucospilota]